MDNLPFMREVFNYGVPTAILFITGYGIYKTTIWLRDKIVEPVTRSHLELIDTLKLHMPKQTDTVNELLEENKKQTTTMSNISDNETRLLTKLTETQAIIIKAVEDDLKHKAKLENQ